MHQTQKRIKLTVDQIPVEGLYQITDYDLFVKIISPYQFLTASLHVPYFARQKRNFKGRKKQLIRESLLHIYRLGREVETNREALKQKLYIVDKTLEILGDLNVSRELLKDQQGILKKLLKAQKIDCKFYQQQLSKLKKANQHWLDLVQKHYDQFIAENISMDVAADQRQEVLKFLGAKYI